MSKPNRIFDCAAGEKMAEGVRFELTAPSRESPVFKTGSLNRSDIPPNRTGYAIRSTLTSATHIFYHISPRLSRGFSKNPEKYYVTISGAVLYADWLRHFMFPFPHRRDLINFVYPMLRPRNHGDIRGVLFSEPLGRLERNHLVLFSAKNMDGK